MSGITIKNSEEIEKLRQGGKILAQILKKVLAKVSPGVTTKKLDELARELMKEYHVEPSFLGFGQPPYPAVLCTSINEELVHCIPSDREIKEGDIVSLDLGIWHKGLCTDMARTVAVGKIPKETKKLIKVTRKALEIAKDQIKPGKTIGDLGWAVQTYVEKHGFSVVRKLVGHGVGYKVHESPRIPNFGHPGEGEKFIEGMVLALEPMVNMGNYEIDVAANQWNIFTKDGSLSAHFEDTIVVTKRGCNTLTVV